MVLINDNSTVLKTGDPMPHFNLRAVDGKVYDSKNFTDPVLVVIFTCNHCPYAQAYEDRLIELAKESREFEVQFVLVNSNDPTNYPEDSFESMKQRSQDKGFPFPYLHDESQELAKAYGALCTPHCFVFDGDRRLRYKGRVDDNWKEPTKVTEQNLRDAIHAVAQGMEPPKTEANAIGCSIKWKSSIGM